MTSRIIVADDHPLFREAMVRTVYRVLPSAHVAEAGSLDEVLQLASVGEALDTLTCVFRAWIPSAASPSSNANCRARP